MTLEGIIIALLIGAIAGWLAGVIVQGAGFGLLGNIVIGIIGAFVAAWLLPKLGVNIVTNNAILTSIINATIGSIVVLLALSLVRRA
ncbi:MAG: GlsB/YeaQ/YmgE family stress response membrane protein [Alphaproteobacteria bacterium]|nr:GlsB/YeaQ/YmgE family stress response membrane protein [Alphaproteobacteria bacterium]